MNKIFINSDNEHTFDIGESSNNNGLKFISVDLISARIKELEMELADSKDKIGLSKAITELRKLIK